MMGPRQPFGLYYTRTLFCLIIVFSALHDKAAGAAQINYDKLLEEGTTLEEVIQGPSARLRRDAENEEYNEEEFEIFQENDTGGHLNLFIRFLHCYCGSSTASCLQSITTDNVAFEFHNHVELSFRSTSSNVYNCSLTKPFDWIMCEATETPWVADEHPRCTKVSSVQKGCRQGYALIKIHTVSYFSILVSEESVAVHICLGDVSIHSSEMTNPLKSGKSGLSMVATPTSVSHDQDKMSPTTPTESPVEPMTTAKEEANPGIPSLTRKPKDKKRVHIMSSSPLFERTASVRDITTTLTTSTIGVEDIVSVTTTTTKNSQTSRSATTANAQNINRNNTENTNDNGNEKFIYIGIGVGVFALMFVALVIVCIFIASRKTPSTSTTITVVNPLFVLPEVTVTERDVDLQLNVEKMSVDYKKTANSLTSF